MLPKDGLHVKLGISTYVAFCLSSHCALLAGDWDSGCTHDCRRGQDSAAQWFENRYILAELKVRCYKISKSGHSMCGETDVFFSRLEHKC